MWIHKSMFPFSIKREWKVIHLQKKKSSNHYHVVYIVHITQLTLLESLVMSEMEFKINNSELMSFVGSLNVVQRTFI